VFCGSGLLSTHVPNPLCATHSCRARGSICPVSSQVPGRSVFVFRHLHCCRRVPLFLCPRKQHFPLRQCHSSSRFMWGVWIIFACITAEMTVGPWMGRLRHGPRDDLERKKKDPSPTPTLRHVSRVIFTDIIKAVLHVAVPQRRMSAETYVNYIWMLDISAQCRFQVVLNSRTSWHISMKFGMSVVPLDVSLLLFHTMNNKHETAQSSEVRAALLPFC
jgi:hypothetical protein